MRTRRSVVFTTTVPRGKIWRIPVRPRSTVTFYQKEQSLQMLRRLDTATRSLERSARTFRYMGYFFIVAGTATILIISSGIMQQIVR